MFNFFVLSAWLHCCQFINFCLFFLFCKLFQFSVSCSDKMMDSHTQVKPNSFPDPHTLVFCTAGVNAVRSTVNCLQNYVVQASHNTQTSDHTFNVNLNNTLNCTAKVKHSRWWYRKSIFCPVKLTTVNKKTMFLHNWFICIFGKNLCISACSTWNNPIKFCTQVASYVAGNIFVNITQVKQLTPVRTDVDVTVIIIIIIIGCVACCYHFGQGGLLQCIYDVRSNHWPSFCMRCHCPT